MTFAATEKGKQMVKEYIEREALISEFKRLKLGENSFIERVFADGVYAIIEQFPAADVAPVQHGRWVNTHSDSEFVQCSLCKYPVYAAWNVTSYCPNCGAKMDKEDEPK